MRSFPLFAFALLSLTLVAPATGWTRNVLLPQDELQGDLQSPMPNLGLGQSVPKKDAAPTQPTAKPTEAEQDDKTKKPTVAEQKAAAIKLIEQARAAKQNASMSTYKTAVKELAEKAKKEEEARKVSFRQDKLDTEPADYFMGDNTASINVQIEPSYLWGADDVQRINRVLGLQPKQISATCQLRMETRVIANESRSYRLSIYAGQSAAIKYKGTPTSVEFSPKAVCRKPAGALPNSGETIRVSGDNYVIQLMKNARCAVQGAPSSVTMYYAGDGTTKCKNL